MKKTIALALALMLCITLLAGCSNDSGKTDNNPPAGNSSQDNGNNNNAAAGGMSGKYLEVDGYADPPNYLEFFEDGKCVFCLQGIKLDGTYMVDGDTITFVSSEFDDADKGTLDGNKITRGDRIFEKEQ